MTIHCSLPDPRDDDNELIDVIAYVREYRTHMVVENVIASDGVDLLPLLDDDEIRRIRHKAIERDVDRSWDASMHERVSWVQS